VEGDFRRAPDRAKDQSRRSKGSGGAAIFVCYRREVGGWESQHVQGQGSQPIQHQPAQAYFRAGLKTRELKSGGSGEAPGPQNETPVMGRGGGGGGGVGGVGGGGGKRGCGRDIWYCGECLGRKKQAGITKLLYGRGEFFSTGGSQKRGKRSG